MDASSWENIRLGHRPDGDVDKSTSICYKFCLSEGFGLIPQMAPFVRRIRLDGRAARLMRKGESKSEQVIIRVDKPLPHVHAEPTLNNEAASFDGYTERDERICLESVLPFLEERIAFKMPSELRHLDGVLDYLNERMLRLGIVNAGDSEVLIALDEAIVNAIKHGNKCDPRKAVHIIAEFSSEGVLFTVTDEGPGFERESVPDPTEPCRLLEPSGRGLLLINHIMDEVRFNQCGNRLEMFKRPANRPQPGSFPQSTTPTET